MIIMSTSPISMKHDYQDQSGYCAASPADSDFGGWENPCESGSGDFERWNKCSRRHVAEVHITHGLKGIRTGETFKYNCTLASCGDCSLGCPEVGLEILDGTSNFVPMRSMCSSKRCGLTDWNRDQCQRLFEEVRRQRPGRSQQIQVPLPVAFSTLTANSYFRSELLHSLVKDAVNSLSMLGTPPTRFDVQSANLTEDPQRTVLVMPATVIPSSVFEITFYMPQQVDADAAESKLREVLSVPFRWQEA